MAILDDLQAALKNGIAAGAASAQTQGVNLAQDALNAIEPNLKAVVAELAAIAQDRVDGNIGDQQAKDGVTTQLNRIPTLITEATELVAVALQAIIDAVLNALKAAIGAATGVAI